MIKRQSTKDAYARQVDRAVERHPIATGVALGVTATLTLAIVAALGAGLQSFGK